MAINTTFTDNTESAVVMNKDYRSEEPIIQVALATPLRRLFDYLLPVASKNSPPPKPGCRVLVPFGPSRKLTGIVTQTGFSSSFPLNKLKRIEKILDQESIFNTDVFKTLLWAAHYYHHPLGEVLHAALPAKLKTGQPAGRINERTLWQVTEIGKVSDQGVPKNAHRQHAALKRLREHPEGLHEDSLKQLEIQKATLVSLEKRNLLTKKIEVQNKTWPEIDHILSEPQLSLSQEQLSAYKKIAASLSSFHCFLLYGITGSGKTEVYLQLINDCLIAKKQALIILPEINLTPQTVSRFKHRFNIHIGVIHSDQSDIERYRAWSEARSGSAAIIIGTRSALFTNFKDLGLIIIDEEHDSSLKQQEGFRYSARDVAIFRAQKAAVPIVLGSATPSLESFHNAYLKKYTLIKLTERAGGASPPKLYTIDLREAQSKDGLSEYAKDIIQQRLEAHEQVLIFINRRGFAPILICNNCGWTAQCDRCDARMVLHKAPEHLHCHHCNRESPVIHYCKNCGCSDLAALGQGTERLESTLEALYPEYPVLRIDRDSTRKKGALNQVLAEINSQKPIILVGTQMIAKGHHFPNVTAVIVVDIDGGLLSADFRGTERTAQLLTQVAGRAGREAKPGSVYIQTRDPEHPLIQSMLSSDYEQTISSILHEREISLFPPYGYLALFRAESVKAEAAIQFLQSLKQAGLSVTTHDKGPTHPPMILGPSPSPMAKKAGKHRAQLLICAPMRKPLHQTLDRLVSWIESRDKMHKIRWSLDIDPIDLF